MLICGGEEDCRDLWSRRLDPVQSTLVRTRDLYTIFRDKVDLDDRPLVDHPGIYNLYIYLLCIDHPYIYHLGIVHPCIYLPYNGH